MKPIVEVNRTFKKGTKNRHTYLDVKYNADGWADARLYRPADFDLCMLKMETITKIGWWCGNSWDGMKIKPTDKVLLWKKQKDEYSRNKL